MSAWPDDADHLARWLAEDPDSAGAPADFISRATYGRYIGSLLRAEIGGSRPRRRLLLENDQVADLWPTDEGLRLTLAMGRTLEADLVVLATGNPAPAPPDCDGIEDLGPGRYTPDPWAAGALDSLAEDAPVLLLGTGLTMVDVALALDSQGHRGPIRAISRRGQAPRRHAGAVRSVTPEEPRSAAPLSRRLADARRRAAEVGWRQAVDEVRPATQAIWRAASLAERRRFLRHLQPWWDVHRHRMAPAVADWFETQRTDGRLHLAAGRIASLAAADFGVRVRWRPRGVGDDASMDVARIINCTGPGADPTRSANPLLRRLIERGLVRKDVLGLGLDVTVEGQVLDASQRPDPRLFAVGPITRGAFWEVTAVPDIRHQVAELARTIRKVLGDSIALGQG